MSELRSRFRTGSVTRPTTPAARLRVVLDDPAAFWERCKSELRTLVANPQKHGDELLELLAVAREFDDYDRVYLAHKQAAYWLVDASHAVPRAKGNFAWAPFFDLVAASLVPLLEHEPHEPELLNLLGVAYFELGDVKTARALFDAVCAIEPEHMQAAANRTQAQQRTKRDAAKLQVPPSFRRRTISLRTRTTTIAKAARLLQERTISLCMIVKDEEEMLPGCLAAVAPWVDELIVVDTGSTDRTVEIAHEFNAQVIDFPWTGSFADARNKSVEAATCDWILYLDADEHMVDDDGATMRDVIKKTWVEGFYLTERHFTGDLELGNQTTHTALRLYQNRPSHRWRGAIHEQKLHTFPTYLPERFQTMAVRIDHFGYLKSVIDSREKHKRNLDLLLEEAAQGQSAFNEFNIGTQYSALNDWHTARKHLELAYELESSGAAHWQASQLAPILITRLITARWATGDAINATKLIDEALTWWPDFTDLVFQKALIAVDEEDWPTARTLAEQCLAMGDAPSQYVSINGRGSYQAHVLLATIARKQNDLAEAKIQLQTALDEAPFFIEAFIEFVDLELLNTPPDEVLASIKTRVDGAGPALQLLLGATFHEHGELAIADQFYERVLAARPHNSAALIARAELRLAEHRFIEAVTLVNDIDDDDLLASRAARTLFLAATVVDDDPARQRALHQFNSTGDTSPHELAFYQAWQDRQRGIDDPDIPAAAHNDAAVAQLVLENLEALAKLEATDAFERLVPLLTTFVTDTRTRHMQLGKLYLRRKFADMAAHEFLLCAQQFGPDAEVLAELGRAATMKEMWADARVFLDESLKLNPDQPTTEALLQQVAARC